MVCAKSPRARIGIGAHGAGGLAEVARLVRAAGQDVLLMLVELFIDDAAMICAKSPRARMSTGAHGAWGLADFARPVSQAGQDFLQVLVDFLIDQDAILKDLAEA